ncbi:hypothetical protein N7493_005798 [Penicillium malachiteum]|uniref:Uncharacterized protein n=1 Tax=Penicillium malachiteum TaxID=1324776 RepID=A0AAD6HKB1_9EURO|nr:hypothetical protein N7493_006087 [Penicillium malachiteum]KAJ5727978.1 hypothetical protein N7493_005798 [Penicillium malachiteum]
MMDQLPSPFSPLRTPHQNPGLNITTQPRSDTSSPPSSRTTSPPASPTSRRNLNPHHLFNLSFPPHTNHDEKNQQPNNHPNCNNAVSILPCAVLRGRSSMMVLRRRPSAIDMALSEERSRCDGNAIERQGLDMMEPRPVDMNMNMNVHIAPSSTSASVTTGGDCNRNSSTGSRSRVGQGSSSNRGSVHMVSPNQPRFVMGGIFEVMEGRA